MLFKDFLKSQQDATTEDAEGRGKAAPGKTIVLAEDEPAARETLAVQVVELGCVPLITDDGRRALAMAHESQPRLVIANLKLKGLSGPDLVAALRADAATRDIPILLVSNTAEPPDSAAGSQVGAGDYITKPINGPNAKTRIRALLLRSSERPAPAEPGVAADPPAERPPADSGHMARAEKLYAECREFAQDAMSRARNSEDPPDMARCRELAQSLVAELGQSNWLLLKAIRPYDPGVSDHDAPNVAVFSIKIGRGLGLGPDELVALAMAALCHEIGMSCVPQDVASAGDKYSRKQWAVIQKHPEHAYRILSKLGGEYRWLAEAVYQEHEREQGQGYPQGLKGDGISELAKIIGLADTYESLSHPRTYRKAFIAFDALRQIIGQRNKEFAPHVIRALVSEVSVFPLESYVLLNTGEIGRVVKTNPDNLLRPSVVVEYDAARRRLKRPRRVDLAAKPLLYVTKPVDERDLAKT